MRTNRIVNLETYLDEVLPTLAETEWVEATFSTLEQYEATCDDIAEIDAKLAQMKSDIDSAKAAGKITDAKADSTKLIATIAPENATNKKVTWSSGGANYWSATANGSNAWDMVLCSRINPPTNRV